MRDVKVANDLYVFLLNKAQELKIMKSGTIGNVRILDNAVVPVKPVSPKKGQTLALSVVLGLAFGVGLAFVKQALSRGVADPDVVERETGLSVFAALPRSDREIALMKRAGKRVPQPVLADTDPDDLAIESVRSLRTSLQFALVDAPTRVVTVLGPSPGVGKTFCAVNLAYVLAEQGKRVVVVDADLRRGRLHRYLDGKRENGLSELIGGTISLDDATRRAAENVDIITTGKTPPNPSALLGSESFERVISMLLARYEFVVLDTPPVLAVTDATLVARLAGVNLLVLRAGRHPVREIDLAVKRLEQGGATVSGVVMNDMHGGSGAGRYYYYYQYEREKNA
jgi:tyrosine-protein kinase Etk/Wzc